MVDLADVDDIVEEAFEPYLEDDGAGNVTMSIADARTILRKLEKVMNDYAGLPMPIDGLELSVEERHPDRKLIESLTKPKDDEEEKDDGPAIRLQRAWYDRKRSRIVFYYWQNGRLKKAFKFKHPYVHRLDLLMNTVQASFAWEYAAELRAQEKLKELLKPHLFEIYQMGGVFLEPSPRSGVMYLFRRLRPTIAMAPLRRWEADSPLVAIATLCLHPVAYYMQSYAGAMAPTDDVIAHLLYMRGDEHGFWKNANQHSPQEDEGGI